MPTRCALARFVGTHDKCPWNVCFCTCSIWMWPSHWTLVRTIEQRHANPNLAKQSTDSTQGDGNQLVRTSAKTLREKLPANKAPKKCNASGQRLWRTRPRIKDIQRFRKGNSATIYWRNGAVENKQIQENKSEKHCEKIPMGNAVGNQRWKSYSFLASCCNQSCKGVASILNGVSCDRVQIETCAFERDQVSSGVVASKKDCESNTLCPPI